MSSSILSRLHLFFHFLPPFLYFSPPPAMSGPDRILPGVLIPKMSSKLMLVLVLFVQTICAIHHMRQTPAAWVAPRDSSTKPLFVSNNCGEVIYPAVLTQSGTGPSTTGFKLNPGGSQNLTVSADWQGRVWGRTNCSFNAQGTGPSHTGGVNGNGAACVTGDCGGTVQCQLAVTFPPFSLTFMLILVE